MPLILELLPAQSVCDVGCGVGTWLKVFASCGASDILGLDGDYVNPGMLQIPAEHFRATNLERPFELERKFNLAIALEVAEHLSPSRADSFVEDLTKAAPAVLFSAAIPNQGGVHHINEQWPSWWARKFERYGFRVCDVIRPKIWSSDKVTPCYRQNTLLFVRPEILISNPRLIESRIEQIDIAHPLFYSRLIPSEDPKLLARYLWWAIHRRLRSWRRAEQ